MECTAANVETHVLNDNAIVYVTIEPALCTYQYMWSVDESLVSCLYILLIIVLIVSNVSFVSL